MPYKLKPGDFIICKPDDKKRDPSSVDFEIYARVDNVDRCFNFLETTSFLKQGRLYQGRRVLPLAVCEERYYQPMNMRELEEFIGGLFALSASKEYDWMKESEKENILDIKKDAVEAWLKFEKGEQNNEDAS